MTNPIISCSSLQEDLNQLFLKDNPQDRTESLGLLEFLFSEENLSGIQRKIAPGYGKLRTVEMLYQPRLSESVVDTTIEKVCSSANEDGNLSVLYQVDETVGVASDTSFDLNHMATMCKDNNEWILRQIQRRIEVCKRKMATLAVEALDGLKGSFASGETGVTANVKAVATKKSDGSLDTDLLEQVSFATLNAGYAHTPIVVGWGELWQYFKRLQAGCCSLQGLDIAKLLQNESLLMLGDRRIAEVYPDATERGYFFSLEPGAIQPIWFNEFEGAQGINVVDDSAYKQTVIIDPKTGIPFDFIWSNNCGKISIQVKLAIQWVGLPNDIFGSGDIFEGVTYVNKYRIVNP